MTVSVIKPAFARAQQFYRERFFLQKIPVASIMSSFVISKSTVKIAFICCANIVENNTFILVTHLIDNFFDEKSFEKMQLQAAVAVQRLAVLCHL